MVKGLKTIGCLLLIFFVLACSNNPDLPDISNSNVQLTFNRFEKDLFINNDWNQENISTLKEKYPEFLPAFTEYIIRIGHIDDPALYMHLNRFKNDPDIIEVKNKVFSIYNDAMTEEFTAIENAFKYYHVYFPDRNIPKIITFISGFNYAIVTDSTYLGIGLDMFLGKDEPFYTRLGYPKYKSANMTRQHLVSSAIAGWLTTEFEQPNAEANLLEEMIHYGKILYLTHHLLPNTEETTVLGYSKEQLEWCKKNEKEIWFFFIDNELLYNNETKNKTNFLGEAPFVKGFPEGSPGRVGQWIGYRIVESYLKNNSVNWNEFMQNNNAQEILNKSKYKP
ncbi:MAG: gliding motility lipoprotein GldB [Vicingaceae bacterium]